MPSTGRSHRLTSLTIIGGFLDGMEIELSEGLNCFIGARGAGKTTVLELVRYAMNVMPELPQEQRRIESLVRANLGSGRIQIGVLTKDGVELEVHRMVGENPIVLDRDGKPANISLQHLLRIDVFSQNEVERIATDPRAQLALIDRFEADRIAGVERRVQAVRSQLAANRGKLAPVLNQTADCIKELTRLSAVETRLEALSLTAGPNRDVINQAHAEKSQRDRNERYLAGIEQGLLDYGRRLAECQTSLSTSLPVQRKDSGKNEDLLLKGTMELEACLEDASRHISQVDQRLALARQRVSDLLHELKLRHQEQELAFRKLIETHREAQKQLTERVAAEKDRNELLNIDAQRVDLVAQAESLEESRRNLLDQLSDLYDEQNAVRRGVVQWINDQLNGRVQIELLQSGDVGPYRELIEQRLATARVKRNLVAERLAIVPPDQMAGILREADARRLVEAANINPDQADKVIESLREWNTILEIEEVPLNDRAVLTLWDGDVPKNSDSLSTGQKCTAVLPILLLESDAPLLVDQPEDNIDNSFISSTIVESIRKVSPLRQLIFVTHNPNIPVLAEADRVFVLRSDGARSRPTVMGNVDECKDDIVRLLEGGESAFKTRKERYAY